MLRTVGLAILLTATGSARAAGAQELRSPPRLEAPSLPALVLGRLGRPEPRELPSGSLLGPLQNQETDYSCGAAALASVLRHRAGFTGGERELYAALETTPKDGTTPEKIAEVASAHGLSARLRVGLTLDDLRAALHSGVTAILDIQAWPNEGAPPLPWADRWEDGHYVVLVGLDESNAYVMDPVLEKTYGWLPVGELLERWHDYEDRTGEVRRNYGLAVLVGGGRPGAVSAPRQRPARVR